jgi:hypothetical protein
VIVPFFRRPQPVRRTGSPTELTVPVARLVRVKLENYVWLIFKEKENSDFFFKFQKCKKIQNQSINQSINQPINQSTNQPINQSTNQSIYLSID